MGRDHGGPAREGRAARPSSSDDDLLERAQRLSDNYLGGLATPESVRWVDNQNSRWGSCTPGDRTIRLSERLQGMPSWVVDYVLVHELAHLLEPGHDAKFWAWVDRYPQAEKAKGYLLGWSAAAPLEPPPRRRRLTERRREREPHQLDQVGLRVRAARRPATSARRATPR